MRRGSDCVAKELLFEKDAASERIYVAEGKELAALTANTKERFNAYWRANRLAGGEVFAQPKEPVCD